MLPYIPDRKLRILNSALESETPPADPLLHTIYSVMKNIPLSDPTIDITQIQQAIDLIGNDQHRYSLTAYFLSGASEKQIAASLHIPEYAVHIFGQLVINMSEFRNKLELRDYVRMIEQTCPDEDARKEIQCGYLYGPVYLQLHWKHGNEAVDVKEKDITTALLLSSYEKGILAKNAPVNSVAAREGLKWQAHTLKILPVHNNLDEKEDLLEEAVLAIKRRQDQKKSEINPADIMH